MARATATPDRLIRTAAELFASQGYGQTGVTEIMEKAQATAGSFYHFFPAKEDLLLAVVDHVAATIESEGLGSAGRADGDPIRRVFGLFRYYRRQLLDNDFALGSPIGTLAGELSESHPEVRGKIAQLFENLVRRIEGLLHEAHGLDAGVDHRRLARHILTTLEGAALQARVRHNIDCFDASVDQLQIFLSMLSSARETAMSDSTDVESRERRDRTPADWRAW